MALKNKHLTAVDRSFIESELNQKTSFKKIGEMLGKDCNWIYRCQQDGMHYFILWLLLETWQ